MSEARLISLPLLLFLDLLALAQVSAAEPGDRLISFPRQVLAKFLGPTEVVSAVPLSALAKADLLADSESVQVVSLQQNESKSQSEESKRSSAPSLVSQTRPATSAIAKPLVAQSSQRGPLGRLPSILQMLEGHEFELLVAASIALVSFVVGWICGGNYYLRRDRRRRTKLRF